MTTPSPAPPRQLLWPDGTRRPALGLGTWRMGESAAQRRAEVAALREAFDIGWRAIDTAEMYGEGGAERVVGEALQGALRGGLPRDDCFIVSKAYPHHADVDGLQRACDASRRRLGVDRIDLYLLHWRGAVPLSETVRGFEALQRRGWIGQWGVSNFDVADMEALWATDGGSACATNQVWLSLGEQGARFALLPWMQARGVPLMAYGPIDQGALVDGASDALRTVAQRHGATPAQVALAALLDGPGVMPIPKAARSAHLRENWGAQFLALDDEDRRALAQAHPPPARKRPLAMN